MTIISKYNDIKANYIDFYLSNEANYIDLNLNAETY